MSEFLALNNNVVTDLTLQEHIRQNVSVKLIHFLGSILISLFALGHAGSEGSSKCLFQRSIAQE